MSAEPDSQPPIAPSHKPWWDHLLVRVLTGLSPAILFVISGFDKRRGDGGAPLEGFGFYFFGAGLLGGPLILTGWSLAVLPSGKSKPSRLIRAAGLAFLMYALNVLLAIAGCGVVELMRR